MNNNYTIYKENVNGCNNDYCLDNNTCECDKYKQKSDELYVKAKYVQDESMRLICEANELNEQAKELERRSKELCAKANMTWDQARKLESESNNLLDLASFYCHKASECYKNLNASCTHKPTCNTACGCKKY